MANVINTSLTWSQEDAQKYFLAPLFYENEHLKGMDVITDVSGASILIDRYTSIKDITKVMGTGSFTADGTQSTNSNVTLTLCRLEVEHAQKAHQLFGHIKSQLLKKGIDRADMTGTIFMEIVSEIVMQGIKRDFSTILWFGDSAGEGTGTQALCNGVWKQLSLAVVATDITLVTHRVVGTNALTNLEAMLALRNNELAAAEGQLIYCSRAFADNYASQLRAADSHVAAYADLQDGISNLRFNGVPLVVIPSWDVDITTYHATLAAMAGVLAPDAAADTQAAIWTMEGNITVGTDFQTQDVDMWYNRDEKENRFRMLYSLGVAVKEPTMCVMSVETA